MKCIECGMNNRLSDRTNHQGFCKKCQHPFAFEPIGMTGAQITDRFFADVIKIVSSDDTVFFTPKQLLYGLNKHLRKVGISDLRENDSVILPLVSVSIAFALLSVIELTDPNLRSHGFSYWLKGNLFLSVFFGLFLLPFIVAIRSVVREKISIVEVTSDQLTEWIQRWQKVNSPIAKLLPEPRETSSAPIDPEIEAYSFDRAIICDRSEVAQLLIANNVHFENNCAILSVTGYPQSIFATVMEMLRRNPELSVYALHDASANGACLIHILRTDPNWFQTHNVKFFDLGLLPRQIFSMRKPKILTTQNAAQQSQNFPQSVRETLSPKELQWLDEGKFVELESFTTQRIIRGITQAISKSQNLDRADSLIELEDDHGYVTYSDSFG